MKIPVSLFDYYLPPELIAQRPADKRDHSRLLVLERKTGRIEHKNFADVINYLQKGDLLVLNNTRVIPANFFGVKKGGSAKIEVLLLKKVAPNTWECLVKRSKRLEIGDQIIFKGKKLSAKVLYKTPEGEVVLRFSGQNLRRYLGKHGEIPLPPYIRENRGSKKLWQRYQTVFAKQEGATAAPTAGLHFTPVLINRLMRKGVKIAYITLHTGVGTFRPVRVEDAKKHKMHAEYAVVPLKVIQQIKKAKQQKKRVVAVGTTCVRALESSKGKPYAGETRLYVLPGFKFKIVDSLITNFHFPKSTLLLLVSAFAGREKIMQAYKKAIDQRYRFFSFGDAMLIC